MVFLLVLLFLNFFYLFLHFRSKRQGAETKSKFFKSKHTLLFLSTRWLSNKEWLLSIVKTFCPAISTTAASITAFLVIAASIADCYIVTKICTGSAQNRMCWFEYWCESLVFFFAHTFCINYFYSLNFSWFFSVLFLLTFFAPLILFKCC